MATLELNRHQAEQVVESLRSGVAWPSLAERLPIGRDALLAEVRRRLQQPRPQPLAVRANFGDGKTHFLQAVAGAARSWGYVVSRVAVSREVPLGRLDQLYVSLAAATRVPDSGLPGIEPILRRLQGQSDWVEERLAEARVPERLRLAVAAYLRDDLEFRDELLADLSGPSLSGPQFRAIVRRWRGRAASFERYDPRRQPLALYRLLDTLIQLAGYPGWVILLDEIELIGKFGRGERAHSYANLAALSAEEGLAHGLLVVAVASNFYPDVLDEKGDREQAPAWLESRAQLAQAEAARQGIAFLQSAEPLSPLSDAQLAELMEAVRQAHAQAYDWQPPPLPALMRAVRRWAPAPDEKLRIRLRVAIQWLDLWQQYGREPQLAVWHLGEVDLDRKSVV